MAESRQIGRLKIHLLGDSAAQLGKSFDGSLSRSMSLKDAMSETARTYRDIYVGGSLEDLRDQPGFDRAGFRPDSEGMRNTNAFGKPSGAESYFIVVTNKKHHLIQDGRTFAGSMDLSLVHELLHPTQIIRELTEAGRRADDSEARTQMREQKIAEELGRTPRQDFPDVLGSGAPYAVQLEPTEAQPPLAPQDDPVLPVDPMKYEGRTPLSPAQPTLLPQADSSSVRRLVRVNGNASPAISAVSSDGRGSLGDLFGNLTSSLDGITPRNPNLPVPPPQTERLLGIVSGKPMPQWTTPPSIFDTRGNSEVADDQNWFTTLGGLLWDGGKSQASALASGALAVPFALDRKASFGNGAASPASGPGTTFVPPASAVQQPQKSATSLIMDYIQHLKPLDASPSQASAFDTGAPSAPLTSPDGITGGPSGAPSPTPQPQNSRRPLSLMDAYLEYRKQLDARSPQASMFDAVAPAVPLVSAADSNLSRGLLGRLTALMGVDPQNPSRLAPSPQDDELRGFYRDDPTQPWFVQR